MPITVYKVLEERYGELNSFMGVGYLGTLNLVYKVGETTTPKFGKIFCFETLEDAIKFCKRSGYWAGPSYRIYEAETDSIEHIQYRNKLHYEDGAEYLIEFWRKERFKPNDKYILYELMAVPLGTVIVPFLKLIKDVTPIYEQQTIIA